jgi:hypothetical protein
MNNPVPQYNFNYKLGVGHWNSMDANTYFQVGPKGGASKGVLLPRIADTASITGTKRNGLLIFSTQLNKYVWYDSTNAVWTQMGSGSSDDSTAYIYNAAPYTSDTIMVVNTTGDTIKMKGLIAGTGMTFSKTDSTITINRLDSSVYKYDGTLTSTRTVNLGSYDYYITSSPSFSSGQNFQMWLPTSSSGGIILAAYNPKTGYASSVILGNSYGTGPTSGDSSGSVSLSASYFKNGAGQTPTSLSLHRVGLQIIGAINLPTGSTSTDYTLGRLDYYQELLDLTSGAANKTVTLPTVDLWDGRVYVINNLSSDPTYKWSISGTVKLPDGTTLTTLTDQTCYTLIYNNTEWKVISIL